METLSHKMQVVKKERRVKAALADEIIRRHTKQARDATVSE